jgi:presenilin-like A22 family membrane protease
MGNIRWGRTLIAAVAVEIVLIAVTMALFATRADPNPILDLVIPPLALILFIPAGQWVARGTSAPILNGFVAGLWGIALYVALTLIMQGAVADFDFESSVRPAYLLAHGLKVVGGGIGGWLVARKLAAG